jgi:hypothetical protein
MLVAFTRRVGRRVPAAEDVIVQASTGPLLDPNQVQTPALAFTGTTPGRTPVTIDLASRLTVDNPAPGAQIRSGVARLRPEEFRTLAAAARLTANVLGHAVEIRPDQIAAMRRWRESWGATPPAARSSDRSARPAPLADSRPAR